MDLLVRTRTMTIDPKMSLSQTVQAMEGASFQGDWDAFKSFFTDDVLFKAGALAEMTGPQACADYFKKMQATLLRITNARIRGTWEVANAVIVEMDVQAKRIPDGKEVGYPSVDVFRFAGGKIAEWRVYAVYPAFAESRG